jgi:hypothetical protein
MGVGGRRHATATLALQKKECPLYRRLGGLQAGLDMCGKPRPTGFQTPNCPARSDPLSRPLKFENCMSEKQGWNLQFTIAGSRGRRRDILWICFYQQTNAGISQSPLVGASKIFFRIFATTANTTKGLELSTKCYCCKWMPEINARFIFTRPNILKYFATFFSPTKPPAFPHKLFFFLGGGG